MNNIEKLFNPHPNIIKEIYFYIFNKLISNDGLKIELDKQYFSIKTKWDSSYNEKKTVGLNQKNAINCFLNQKILDFQNYEIDILNDSLILEIFFYRNGMIYDQYEDTFRNISSLFFNFPLFDNEKIAVEFNGIEIFDNFKMLNQKFLQKISDEHIHELNEQFNKNNKIVLTFKLKNLSNNHKIFNEQCLWFDNNNDLVLKIVEFWIKNEFSNINKEDFLNLLRTLNFDQIIEDKDVFEVIQWLGYMLYYYETHHSYAVNEELEIIKEEMSVFKELFNNLKKINS